MSGAIPTLTREAALALIDEAAAHGRETLLDLYNEWVGYYDGLASADVIENELRSFVAERCMTDNVRSNGPHADDDTGIPA